MRRLLVALAMSTMLVVTACGHVEDGRAVSVSSNPFRVAGMAADDGPSGLRPNAPAPNRPVRGSDGSAVDTVAVQAISDVEDYWKNHFRTPLRGAFAPIEYAMSWDSKGPNQTFCRRDTLGVANAAFCPPDNAIGWDRGLMASIRAAYGDTGVVAVLAHEYGHALQYLADLVDDQSTPAIVLEQQADCFSGVYMRAVAEGQSRRFTLSAGDGLNKALATIVMVRDPAQARQDYQESVGPQHGSAFERVTAVQMGFTDGTDACVSIDEREIAQRRGALPSMFEDDDAGTEYPINQMSVTNIVTALTALFKPASPPTLTFGATGNCPNALPTPPASYCPATNAIRVDLAALQQLAALHANPGNAALASGDNAAYSVIMSRYMLSMTKQRGAALDDSRAPLRTACLTGVATAKFAEPVRVSDGVIRFSAGDLNEAVSGMLTDGIAASDVNGVSVPAGFSRIDAFRTGVIGDAERCFQRFP
jgi:predicted metalloprotease